MHRDDEKTLLVLDPRAVAAKRHAERVAVLRAAVRVSSHQAQHRQADGAVVRRSWQAEVVVIAVAGVTVRGSVGSGMPVLSRVVGGQLLDGGVVSRGFLLLLLLGEVGVEWVRGDEVCLRLLLQRVWGRGQGWLGGRRAGVMRRRTVHAAVIATVWGLLRAVDLHVGCVLSRGVATAVLAKVDLELAVVLLAADGFDGLDRVGNVGEVDEGAGLLAEGVDELDFAVLGEVLSEAFLGPCLVEVTDVDVPGGATGDCKCDCGGRAPECFPQPIFRRRLWIIRPCRLERA